MDLPVIHSTEPDAPFCSTALLDAGADQTFSYIGCGSQLTTVTLLAAPTTGTPITVIPTTEAAYAVASIESDVSTLKKASTSQTMSAILQANTTNSPLPPLQDPPTLLAIESAASATATSSPSPSPINVGGIIGGVLGGLLALICAITLGIMYMGRSRQRRTSICGNPSRSPPLSFNELPNELPNPKDQGQLPGPQYAPQPASWTEQAAAAGYQTWPAKTCSRPVGQPIGELAELPP